METQPNEEVNGRTDPDIYEAPNDTSFGFSETDGLVDKLSKVIINFINLRKHIDLLCFIMMRIHEYNCCFSVNLLDNQGRVHIIVMFPQIKHFSSFRVNKYILFIFGCIFIYYEKCILTSKPSFTKPYRVLVDNLCSCAHLGEQFACMCFNISWDLMQINDPVCKYECVID